MNKQTRIDFDSPAGLGPALDNLEQARRDLVAIATDVAVRLARKNGAVTSPQVVAEMLTDESNAEKMEGVDRRFMGAVFRSKKWSRVGFVPAGSHGQQISQWKLKTDEPTS